MLAARIAAMYLLSASPSDVARRLTETVSSPGTTPPPHPVAQQKLSVRFGPPQPFKGYGGKMSNTLDLYPDGFASGRNDRPVSSADGGKTFQNVSSNATFFSDFSFYTDAEGHRVAQDFGAGLVYVHHPT